MIQYFENFANSFLRDDIQKEILESPNWLWQYRTETSGQYEAPDFAWIEDENTEDVPQLIHVVGGNNSADAQIISPLMYNISELVGFKPKFQRIKVNLLWPNALRNNPNSYHRPHADHGQIDAKSLIYYVNDSDGDTIIFDKHWNGENPGKLTAVERITPKAGAAVLFDSTRYHTSSSPTKNVRSVINFIFWPSSTNNSIPLGAPGIPNNLPIGKGFHNL